jgi:hypothetical protein
VVEGKASILRPRFLSAVVACCVGSLALALAGLADVRTAIAEAPQIIAVEAAALETALEESPVLATAEAGPVAWLVTAPDCEDCRHLEEAAFNRLSAAGIAVKVVMAPANESPNATSVEARAFVAALAARQDYQSLAPCLVSRRDEADSLVRRVACRTSAVELSAPAIEGYLEWGRASHERIAAVLAANGLEPRAPALIWRRGGEWRAAVGRDQRSVAAAVRDLTAGA